MPEIPTVASPQLTPKPEMNPRIAGQPGAALASAADQMASVADFGAQVSERIKRAQDEGILLGAENSINADVEQAQSGLSAWTDYTKADELKEQTAAALREKYAEKYGDRPDLMRHIEPYIGQRLNEYNKHVDVKTAELTSQFNQVALSQSERYTVDQAATEPTVDGKEKLWAVQDAKTDLMVQNGSLWPIQGEEAKRRIRAQTIATEVERAANPMNAPEVMEAEMQRLKEYQGKDYVAPEKLAELQAHMGEAYKVALTRADNIDVSKQGDAILSSLKADPTFKDPETQEFDHMAAVKKIDNDPNVPTKVKKYVRQELEEEAGATQKLTNDNDQKMLDSLDPLLETGQLTSAEIKRRENLAPGQPNAIPRRVADHLLTRSAQIQRENRAQNMEARRLSMEERREKSNEIAQKILFNGVPIVDKSDLTPYMLKGLTNADANALMSVLAIKNDKGWTDAVAMMNASPLYDATTDEGRQKLAKDTLQFAQTVKNKNLHGAQITEELSKELHPAEQAEHKETVKTLLDNIWTVGGSVITGTPLPGRLRFAPSANPSGATPKAPTSRKDYFDALKKVNPNTSDADLNKYLDQQGVK